MTAFSSLEPIIRMTAPRTPGIISRQTGTSKGRAFLTWTAMPSPITGGHRNSFEATLWMRLVRTSKTCTGFKPSCLHDNYDVQPDRAFLKMRRRTVRAASLQISMIRLRIRAPQPPWCGMFQIMPETFSSKSARNRMKAHFFYQFLKSRIVTERVPAII